MTNTQFPKIKEINTFISQVKGVGGDYHDVERGHWLVDNKFSTPMSKYPDYRKSRVDWGLNVLGSFYVEVVADDGTTGFATGFGGPSACWIVKNHFERFLIGQDPRDLNKLSDQMLLSSMFYGRKGLVVAAISVVDLALWDLLGQIRKEPVYKMIGGAVKDEISFYCTGCNPAAAKEMGFWGGKVPLPYGPDEGQEGLRKNVEFLRKHRESVGPDFPLMVDCWMSLTVPYVIELVEAAKDLHINWWEETLHPDDIEGYASLKRAHPTVKFTTGEHEYTRYGFRRLIEGRNIDILQPDVMWVGGLTELLRVTAQAAAYDIPIVSHASGPYSYHIVASQINTPFQEYLASSFDSKSITPVFGNLFLDEPVPHNGVMKVSQLDKPGFGLTRNPEAPLILCNALVVASPERPLKITNGPETKSKIESN